MNELKDERTRFQPSDLTGEEKARFAGVLLTHFPWLGTQDEHVGGADTIYELDVLYRHLEGEELDEDKGEGQ